MKPKKYFYTFVLFYFIIEMNGYAQNEQVMDIGEIEIIPGATIRPDDSRGEWTEDMYRQWFEAIRKYNEATSKRVERPAIQYPDFSQMTDEQLSAWSDSILNMLYPELVIGTYDKATGRVMTQIETENANNPLLTTRAGYTNNYVPNAYTINKNRAVGDIPYSSAVLPSGAMAYSIPINIYPGINGFQPNLSINYNSHSGIGIMGKGWYIGGLSSIMRTTKNLYYNNKAEGVLMNKDDPFVLDGLRLIKIDENASQITYETETGNTKVNAYLLSGVIRYFEVKQPNGTVAIYGDINNYYNSYLEYPLTKLTDRFDNTINYTYSYSDNHYNITEISYGNASITFTYDSSPTDYFFYYEGGLKVFKNKRLLSIGCKYASNVLHNYSFSYGKNRIHLSEISLSSGDVYLSPLRFYYGTDNNAYIYSNNETQLWEWYNFSSPNQLRTVRGKFDYGTEDDGIITTPHKLHYYNETRPSGPSQQSRNRYNNQYIGTEKIFFYTGLGANDSFSFADPIPSLLTEDGFIDILCANIDGKYEDEVVIINNTNLDNINEKITFRVLKANLYNGLGFRDTITFNFPTVVCDNDNGYSIHPKFYRAGDFTGNGKMEIFAVSCDNPSGMGGISKCYLFDLDSGTILFESYVFPYVVSFTGNAQMDEAIAEENTDRLLVFDYDGDGKSDICLINSSGLHIYTFDITGSTYSMNLKGTYSGITKSGLAGRQLLTGDFNGDGKLDFLISPIQGQNIDIWEKHYSRGNGQFEISIYAAKYNINGDRMYTQNINNDAMTDLLIFNGSGFYTYLMHATGNIMLESYTAYDNNAIDAIIVPVDINNNNYFSRLVCLKDGIAMKYAYPRDDTKEHMMTGLINSWGVIEKNHYQKLNDNYSYGGAFFTQGSDADYPYLNIKGPLYVTASREQYYDNQLYNDFNFRYENAVSHNQGLGFCGFSKIMTKDNIRNREYIQTYDPYRSGIVVEDESPVHKLTNDFTVNVLPNKIIKISLDNQTALDKLKGITQTATYTYDAYGSVTGETIDFGDNITQTTANVPYNNTGTPYILGALTDQTVTVTRNGSSNSKRIWLSSHNHGIPLTVITYANGLQTAETVYTYNSLGNVLTESVKPYTSSNVLTITRLYDAYGRITKETTPLGLYTSFEYNPSTGLLSNTKDHKLQATTYAYDSLLRRTIVAYPDGVIDSLDFVWSASAGLYGVTSNGTCRPSQTSFYDAFGREVRTSVVRYDGTVLHSDVDYDSFGRAYRESLPFSSSAATLWNTTSFDMYDRPTGVAFASGKSNAYSYSGKNVTKTADGITSTFYYDTQGNLTSVTDPAGTITYNLRPDGQPSSIVSPGNITTDFGFDNYGRQTGINDPSAGSRSFQYDNDGNLWKETNADNRVKTMLYDPYGRITKKVMPEFTVNYRYDNDGLLASDSSDNGAIHTFIYDTYFRLQKERDNSPDSKWLEKTYAYSEGNLSNIRFESNLGVIGTEYYTYANGHLSEIKLGSTSVWQLTGENSLGQTTLVTTGPVARSYNFNAYGIPEGQIAATSSAGAFQNHTYSIDALKGNLSFRKDNTRNLQENFTYDNLNRLKTFAGFNMEYDVKGNILEKSDAGVTFYYNTPNKPYAISGVDAGTKTAIPLRNQTVTYTSFERPASISENNYQALFTYSGAGERKKMEVKNNSNTLYNRYYLGGRYETDLGTSINSQRLYIGGNAYTAPAVYVNQGSGWALYYICRDHLGSISHLISNTGTVANEYSYDAWGRLRDPVTQVAYAPGSEPNLFLGRGYTGHEHLPQFGLVNMNARLYDPAIGRFLSPDPHIQAPNLGQNFNRYSYVLNNPLSYTDPSGEKLKWWHFLLGGLALFDPLSALTTALAVSGTAGATAFTVAPLATGTIMTIAGSSYATTIANTPLLFFGGAIDKDWARGRQLVKQSWEINNGLFFSHDPNRSFKDQAQQFTSRLTWEGLQTIVGYNYTQLRNGIGDVNRVDHFGGATWATRENAGKKVGITLGNYINLTMSGEITGEFQDFIMEDEHYMHEYGHYLQGRRWGPLYLPVIGVSSALSMMVKKEITTTFEEESVSIPKRRFYWFERGANRYARRYFRGYGVPWNERLYPITDRR